MNKLRILSFNRTLYSDVKTFYSSLSSNDKPSSSLRFSTVMRTSNDSKYMTLAFIYASTDIRVMMFSSYNANIAEAQISDTDRIIGEFIYTTD